MKNAIKLSVMGIMLVVGVLALNSCNKNPGGPIGNTDYFDNSETVTASFMGQVIKEDGSPLIGATVSIGNHSFIADDDGFFYFTDINTYRQATLIKVEMNGYFDAFRTIRVIPNQDNQTRIMALALPAAQTFSAAAGGSITIANGGSIDFVPNSIVDEATNAPYNGTVSVYAKWIDPTSDDLSLMLPGDLRAVNAEGAERGLTTFGMQAIELRDGAGNELQLKDGSNAAVHFPIHAALTSTAPETIPLWSLEENTGLWVEDGTAQKVGAEYVGAVTHFSYWNCDAPWTLVSFQATFVDANNNPIVGGQCKLKIQGQTWNSVGTGWTNSTGTTLGQIPMNKTFDLEFYPSGCNTTTSTPSYSTTFSTTTANINLGTITTTASTSTTTITGTVEDCGNNLLANAPVKMSLGGWQIYTTTTNASGVFSFSQNCLSGTPTATITAYDVVNAVNGSSTATITPSIVNNVGLVQACGTQNDFINWSSTIGAATTNFSITAPVGNLYQSYQLNTYIGGSEALSPTNSIFASFDFDGPQTVAGTHNLMRFEDHLDSTSTISPAIVNLTNYQAVGGKVEGSFNTTVTGWTYPSRPISCSFRVTRSN